MNIIQLVVSNSFGGVEAHICTLVKMMDDMGYHFTIICNDATEEKFREELQGYNVEIVALPLWPYPSLPRFFKLLQLIKKLNPDMVHCHLYSAMRIGAIAAKLVNRNCTVIETIHIEEVWRKGINKILYNIIDAIIGRLCVDHYLGVSKAVTEFYHTNKRVPYKKLSVVHNTTELQVTKTETKQFSRTVGFLGRLEEQKGVDILIDALASLNTNNNEQWELIIGGTGSLEETIKKQVDELKLSDKVTFLGNVTDKQGFFNLIDIFALPSRFEGFPLVLLEAGICHKPVVATAVSGTPEIITNCETGFLVDKDNIHQLADALRKLSNEPIRNSLADRLHNRVKEELSPNIYSEKMNTFYKSIRLNKGGQNENTCSYESVSLSCK